MGKCTARYLLTLCGTLAAQFAPGFHLPVTPSLSPFFHCGVSCSFLGRSLFLGTPPRPVVSLETNMGVTQHSSTANPTQVNEALRLAVLQAASSLPCNQTSSCTYPPWHPTTRPQVSRDLLAGFLLGACQAAIISRRRAKDCQVLHCRVVNALLLDTLSATCAVESDGEQI